MIAQTFVQSLDLKDDGTFKDAIQINLRAGEVVAIVGPNGVGKSALAEEMARYLRGQSDVELFSGHRQIFFQSDDVDQIGQSVEAFRAQLVNPQVNRMRNPWGEQHLRSVVRRIINRQNQDNHDLLDAVRANVLVADAENLHALILDELNGVFESARLAIKIILKDGTLRAQRGSDIYGIDRMSDGERSALLVAGAILVRPTNGRIIIDEPERHLNPAISGPLIAAAIRARPDVGYLFATHDLGILSWINPDQIIHVSASEIIHPEPEVRRYRVEQVGNTSLPSEDLKTAVYGSRKALLLVEGTEISTDEALFGFIYQGRNVTGRGGWESVVSEVKSLNRNSDLIWLSTSGIIDGDGRDGDEIDRLESDGVYCLPCPSIENLFFLKAIVAEMIKLHHSLNGGNPPHERLSSYEQAVRSSVSTAKDDMINRRVVWRANRVLAANKVSVKSVRKGQKVIHGVDIAILRSEVAAIVETAIAEDDVHASLLRLPIKNTRIPAELSSEIGFASFLTYKQAILHQMQAETTAGTAITAALTSILPSLPPI